MKQTSRQINMNMDAARPELGRPIRIIRELPVEQLTATECMRLIVHSHSNGPSRRAAYWAKVQAQA